jgi:hypothetical protein
MRGQAKKRSPNVVPLHALAAPAAVVGVRLGTVTGWSEDRGILVDYPGSPRGPEPAASAIKLSAAQLDALVASRDAVLLTFEAEEPARPILFGFTQPIPSRDAPPEGRTPRAVVDGEVVELAGRERIELRCGKASIVLTKEGKIVLRGTFISSASSGAHRIRGGSIEIN